MMVMSVLLIRHAISNKVYKMQATLFFFYIYIEMRATLLYGATYEITYCETKWTNEVQFDKT